MWPESAIYFIDKDPFWVNYASTWLNVSYFVFLPYSLLYHVLAFLFNWHMSEFDFLWIFVMSCFLKILLLAIWWQHHTKVSGFWVHELFFLLPIFYCNILTLFINVFNIGIIVWNINFLEFLGGVFVYIFMLILFNLIFLFCKIKGYL